MKELSDASICVFDRGVFWPVAQRLARDFKKVYYHRPNGEEFETFAQACKGDGHPDVTYVDSDDFFYGIRNKLFDGVVFPDCADGGLQVLLESLGFPVWGSKEVGSYERMRGRWHKLCEEVGLPLPKTHVVIGLSDLTAMLKDHESEELFVKISKYRGDMETWGTKDPLDTAERLWKLKGAFGPFADDIRFYVQEKVKTTLEGGSDSYFTAGQWPNKIVLGYEKKGESYFATWKHREEMPKEVWGPNEKITAFLAEMGYSNLVSSEVRITAEGQSFWLDPCFRTPSPAGEEELELYKNFPEIVWNGMHGIHTQPVMAAKYCGEAVISYTGEKGGWKAIKVPEEVRPFVKLYACGYRDGYSIFPPAQDPEAIGCAIALADTPSGVLDGLKGIAKALENAPVELHIEPIADLFKEIEEAESQGIEFGPDEMPEPAEVIESS